WVRLDERTGLEDGAAEPAISKEVLFQNPLDEMPCRALPERIFRTEADGHEEMIVEVVAHAGQIDQNIDAVRAEMIGRANAAEHEDLRRADGASRKNHLGGSAINLALSVLDDLHAGGATVFDDDALGMRVEDDGQVRKVLAADEALRGAMTHAVCAGHLVEARCELLGAVEVTVGFDPKIVGNRLGERLRNGADLILGMTSDVNL